MFVKLSKLFFSIFLLYKIWYSQIWGANQYILYLSVGFSALFVMIDAIFVLKRLPISQINPIVKMYFTFCIYVFASGIIVSIDKTEFIASLFTYISFTIVAFEVWYISFRTNSFRWVLNILYILALICAMTTIFNGQDYRTEVIVKTMGEFNNPNTLGVLMVFGIFTVVFDKVKLENRFILKYLSIFVFLYVILISGSRKALFAGVSLFVFWVVEYYIDARGDKISFKKIIILSTIILSLVGASLYIVNEYVGSSGHERLLMFFKEGGTSGRWQLMNMAVEYWKTSPIFGIGLDQFKILNPYGYYSHSTYFEILSCTGILGCLIFFGPLIRLLFTSIRKSFERREDLYKIRICMLMIVIELFLGIGQIFIYSPTHMIILVFLANVIYEKIDVEKDKRRIVKIKVS